MSWIELKLIIPQHILEQISSYLFAHGCEGINVSDDGIIIYFSTHRWSDEVKLSIVEYIRHLVPGFGIKNIRVKAISDQDWNADWKKHFKPIKVTDTIVIRPPWEKYHSPQGELVITINPQMAFGTGHHESTKLAIIEMEKSVKPGIQVLDVGTGSGILAIISEKLGAESVLGIDNDMDAIKNANENAAMNHTRGSIHFGYAELEQVTPSDYDVVLANINRNVLLNYATLFPDFIKQNGLLILSGILRSDEMKIVQAYTKNGFVIKRKRTLKEWLALVLELKDKKENKETNV